MRKVIILLACLFLSGCFAAPNESYTYQTVTDEQSGKVQKLALNIFTPKADSKTLPNGMRGAVVLVHGGAWNSKSKSDMAAFAVETRDLGYVAIAVDYRSTSVKIDGRGERGVVYPWPAQANDVRCALGWVVENAATYDIDVTKIVLAGESSGGQISLMVAENDFLSDECPYRSDVDVALSVSRAGPTDLEHWYNLGGLPAGWIKDLLNKDFPTEEELRSVSPAFNLGTSGINILQQQGGKDIVVPEEIVYSFSDNLDSLGREHTFLYYPEGTHALTTVGDVDIRREALSWMDEQLQK